MTLPELRSRLEHIEQLSPQDVRLRDLFLSQIDEWDLDDSTALELLGRLNRTLGNVWFSSSAVHAMVFQALQSFAKEVQTIDGMTLAERLFVVGLLHEWDASDDARRRQLRFKLGAA